MNTAASSMRPIRAHVLHVEDYIFEFLVEHAALNLIRGLRGFQLLLHLQDRLVGARRT